MCEPDKCELALKLMEKAKNKGVKLMLPVDTKIGKEFKLIEQNTKTVFIAMEPEAKQLLEEIKLKGMSRNRMRKAGQYCIQVYDNMLENMKSVAMVRLDSADMEEFYQLNCEGKYSEDVGVDLLFEMNQALFL